MKKIFSIFIIINIILSSCSIKDNENTNQDNETIKYVKTEKIQKKNFTEDLKLIWKVSSSQETIISPLASWNIKSINVNIWDKVKAWDILATIETQSNLINISLNNADKNYLNTLNIYNSTKEYLEKNLQTTKLQYENAIKNKNNIYLSTEKELNLSQANLESITSQKTNTKKSSESSINIVKNNLENAKITLENFNINSKEIIKTLENKKKSTLDDIKISIDNSISNFDSTINYIDTILWVTNLNKRINDEYEIYLSAKNASLKSKAETKFNIIYNDFIKINSDYNQTNNLNEEELLIYYTKILNFNNNLIDLLNLVSWVLDNSITTSSLTQEMLSNFKLNIRNYQVQIISLKTTLTSLNNSLKDIKDNINSTKINNETQKSSYEQAVKIEESNLENIKLSNNSNFDNLNSTEKTAKIQLENTIANITSSRSNADDNVNIAKSQYEAALSNYNSSLSTNKSQLDNIQSEKMSREQQLVNTLIKAPFDWIITQKNINIWQSVSNSTEAFSISNSNKKIIKLDVTWENLQYFKLWQEVTIVKNNKNSTWVISIIWTSADTNTWMFKIEVAINDNNFNQLIPLWEFADVYIKKTISNEKYLIVPFSSLIVWSNETYSAYIVWKNNKVEIKDVTIWKSNSKEVIIKSWLNEWEIVIIEWALKVSIWDEVREI